MKVIIAGSRTWQNYSLMERGIRESGFAITEVVSGMAMGADSLGETWATERNVPIKQFPAERWRYGKSAGLIRNQKMAEYADALILCWDGKSRGSANMLKQATECGLPSHVVEVEDG